MTLKSFVCNKNHLPTVIISVHTFFLNIVHIKVNNNRDNINENNVNILHDWTCNYSMTTNFSELSNLAIIIRKMT